MYSRRNFLLALHIAAIASLAASCGGSGSSSSKDLNAGQNQSVTTLDAGTTSTTIDLSEYPEVGVGEFGKLAVTTHTSSLGAEFEIRYAITDIVKVDDPSSEISALCSLKDLPEPGSQFRAIYFDAKLISIRRSPVPFVIDGYQVEYKDGTKKFFQYVGNEVTVVPPGPLFDECIPKKFDALRSQQFYFYDKGLNLSFEAKNLLGQEILEEVEPGGGIANFRFTRMPRIPTWAADIKSVSYALLITESVGDKSVVGSYGSVVVGNNPGNVVIVIHDVFESGSSVNVVNATKSKDVAPEVKLCLLLNEFSSPQEILSNESSDWVSEVEALLDLVNDYDLKSLGNEFLQEVRDNPSGTYLKASLSSLRTGYC